MLVQSQVHLHMQLGRLQWEITQETKERPRDGLGNMRVYWENKKDLFLVNILLPVIPISIYIFYSSSHRQNSFSPSTRVKPGHPSSHCFHIKDQDSQIVHRLLSGSDITP